MAVGDVGQRAGRVLLGRIGARGEQRNQRRDGARAHNLALIRIARGEVHQRASGLLLAGRRGRAANQLDERPNRARLCDLDLVVLIRVRQVRQRAGDLLHLPLLLRKHLHKQGDRAALRDLRLHARLLQGQVHQRAGNVLTRAARRAALVLEDREERA